MTTKTGKKGAKKTKTISVAFRTDPKTKFAMDLIGRKHIRNLTSVFEWVVAQAISRETHDPTGMSLSELVSAVWSVDEQERLLSMHRHCPELLTFDEEVEVRELLKKSEA